MVERFLRYSLEHGRAITLIVQDEKCLKKTNLTVVRLEDDTVYYITARSAKEKPLKRECILSAAYARGDDGDTLKRENAQYQLDNKL